MEGGHGARARFLITAIGVLSAPQMPKIEGLKDYKGEWFHTGLWPKYQVDFAGKRVGVIGTGASAVQLITEIGKEVGHLTVFSGLQIIARRRTIRRLIARLNSRSRSAIQISSNAFAKPLPA
jgi:cation diffusion facilitator CzcD-associated flavoprotein CzcO